MDERGGDWHRGVDENLASLNAGQRVWEREIDHLHKALSEIDTLLRGDPDRDTDGVIARLHQLENAINLLRAIILKDAAGGRGLVSRVEALETGERSSDNRWKFATAVVVAVLSFAGLLLTNWDRLEGFLNSHRKMDPLEKMIEKAKHPKARRRHVVIRQEPVDPEPEGEN
jgi:uncharacterized protein HemX